VTSQFNSDEPKTQPWLDLEVVQFVAKHIDYRHACAKPMLFMGKLEGKS
jgi:hypothetical protein